MALGAHPDDIELSMAGLLLRFAAAGHRLSWIVATDGA
ncbi:PIG-L family deacetylase, partial [Acinetobacter baumannii]